MNNNFCEIIRETLVDYDDGQLKANQVAEVSRHLNACPACSRELQALQNSLALAKDIWHDAAANLQDVPITLTPTKRLTLLKRFTALAACLALPVALTILIWASRARQTPGPSAVTQISPAARAARLIEREAASAKLAASSQILADSPGGQQFASAAFQYLAHTYPQTTMGKQALNKISSN